MEIWLINPFDPLPGESSQPWRYTSLATLLTKAGYKVTWWSSSFSHSFKRIRDQSLAESSSKNLCIKLISVPPYKSNLSVQRLYNHWVYAKRFEREAIEALEKGICSAPNVIIASSPPLCSARAAIRVAQKASARIIIDIQDLWPEAFQMFLPRWLRHISKIFFYPLLKLENANFRDCDGLSAVSRDYLDRALSVQKREKPTAVIHLGIDLARFDEAARQSAQQCEKSPGDFWAVYVGSISHNYDLVTVIEAARLLKQNNMHRIKFFIVGHGPLLSSLKELATRLNLANVKFTGFLDYPKMVEILLSADVAINAIKQTYISFPNKVFDYCAAGLPIINSIAGGELEALINNEKIGLQYMTGVAESLVDSIIKLYSDNQLCRSLGKNARRLAEKVFDRSVEYQRFLDLIARVLAHV